MENYPKQIKECKKIQYTLILYLKMWNDKVIKYNVQRDKDANKY